MASSHMLTFRNYALWSAPLDHMHAFYQNYKISFVIACKGFDGVILTGGAQENKYETFAFVFPDTELFSILPRQLLMISPMGNFRHN